jgi:hypothetical protein
MIDFLQQPYFLRCFLVTSFDSLHTDFKVVFDVSGLVDTATVLITDHRSMLVVAAKLSINIANEKSRAYAVLVCLGHILHRRKILVHTCSQTCRC